MGRSAHHSLLDFGVWCLTVKWTSGGPQELSGRMLAARVGGHRRSSSRYSYNAGSAGLVVGPSEVFITAGAA
jgi:hypothetical protein